MRLKPAAAEAAATYQLPPTLTPFTTLDLLRKIYTDAQLALGAEQREELGGTMAAIERFHFTPQPETANAPDLEAISRSWIEKARRTT
jgi:hypothetical protein